MGDPVVLNLLDLDRSAQETCTAGSDETNFLSRNCGACDGGSFPNVLVVTTTVGMVDGVHSNTTSTRPAVALSLVLVVGPASLKQWLVDSATTRNNSHRRTCAPRDCLLRTRRESYPGLVVFWRVADDSCVITGRASEGTTVAEFLFHVAHDGTFGALVDGKNVSDRQGSFFAAVDEGAGVEALGSDEGLRAQLVAIGVTENDAGKGCTTSRVMDDFFHDTANVAITLRVVQRADLSRCLVVVSVCLEDGM